MTVDMTVCLMGMMKVGMMVHHLVQKMDYG